MDIIHLVYFTEVARQGSFTKAAEVLYVSQSTISKLRYNNLMALLERGCV